MRVEIDTGRCIGSGQCARLLPELFGQDDDTGTAVVVPGARAAGPAVRERLTEVRAACPVAAIGLQDTREEARR